MDDQGVLEREHHAFRQEILERVKFLHQVLSLATLLWGALLIFGFFLAWQEVPRQLLLTYILITPIIFSTLTYNYQANQMTMEAVARYLYFHLKPAIKTPTASVKSWDEDYASEKNKYRLISFLKVSPLLLPQSLPIIIVFWLKSLPEGDLNLSLWVFDLFLFGLTLFNFRYKSSKE